jgi:hypothetical protein
VLSANISNQKSGFSELIDAGKSMLSTFCAVKRRIGEQPK